MLRKKWNTGWKVSKAGDSPMMAAVSGMQGEEQSLILPHDAMIHEKRTKETKNQHQTGFYPGGCYTYTKVFEAPEEWKDKTVRIEFEGVYTNARVFINGDYAGGHPYGYTEFIICADDFLNYGGVNTVQIIANNSAEENSRWYTGSGIYRNVNILVGNQIHIQENSVRITTPEVEEDLAVAEVEVDLRNLGTQKKRVELQIKIQDRNENTVALEKVPVTLFAGSTEHCRSRIQIENPFLWSCETPDLYECQVVISEGDILVDEAVETFGIRTLSLTAKKGLRINGKEVKLRGACIHHDNGVIGACTLEKAEKRRLRQLKEAGFNCIRSSHHPVSRAMLDACDREGVLVLDELFDCWTRAKNNNDYAQYFTEYWEKDAERMVAKDFNHPSVIMYISGNEIQEAGTAKGAQLNRVVTEKLHALDDTRYVTVAINGLLSCMDRMGDIICDITGMTMEQMMQMQAQAASAPASDAGSDAANGSTDLMKGPMADAFAANHIVTEMLEEFSSVTDLVGYNYLTSRHEMEHTLYPNRVILGTETLPSDIVRLWKIVKENPHVIGDMTWTGYDYLGEAGAGVFYYDGRQGFMPNWPISIAYLGDIDIIGYRRPMSYFREIVYGLRKEPYIAVEPLNHYGEKPNQSAWLWKDEIASWTWNGYEGKPAVVNVYSDAEEVELFLNGRSLGRKPAGEANGFMASFETVYEAGKLEAVNYRNGVDAQKCSLESADSKVELCVEADCEILKADGADLAYLMISLEDIQGRKNLQAVREVTVTVEGAGTLQGFGSADPATENDYDNTTWETYDGYLLAVVRAGLQAGEIKVSFEASGCEKKEVTLQVQ